MTGLTQSGANPDSAARPGDVLFTSLAIGSYRLGLYDSATPTAGTAYFEIGTAVVPLPAAAWLFGSALLGLGAARRKKA